MRRRDEVYFIEVRAVDCKVINLSTVYSSSIVVVALTIVVMVAACTKHKSTRPLFYPGCLALHFPELFVCILNDQIIAVYIATGHPYRKARPKKFSSDNCLTFRPKRSFYTLFLWFRPE